MLKRFGEATSQASARMKDAEARGADPPQSKRRRVLGFLHIARIESDASREALSGRNRPFWDRPNVNIDRTLTSNRGVTMKSDRSQNGSVPARQADC